MKRDIRGNTGNQRTYRLKRKGSPAEITKKQIQFEKELLEKINWWANQSVLRTGVACVSIAIETKNDVYKVECFGFPKALTEIYRQVPYKKRYLTKLTVIGDYVKSADADNVEVPFYDKSASCQILDINCQLFIKILNNINYLPSKSFFDNAKRHFDESKRVMAEKAKAQDFNY